MIRSGMSGKFKGVVHSHNFNHFTGKTKPVVKTRIRRTGKPKLERYRHVNKYANKPKEVTIWVDEEVI